MGVFCPGTPATPIIAASLVLHLIISTQTIWVSAKRKRRFMVELSIKGNDLHVEVFGWSRLLGLKRSLDIPLSAIKQVSATSGLPHFQWSDIRAPGTGVPGVVAIGTYWMGSPRRRAFIDVTRWSKQAVKLEIEGQPYSLVIAEVKDALAAINLLKPLKS